MLATTVPATEGDGTPSFVLDTCAALSSAYAVTVIAPRVRNSRTSSVVGGVRVARFPYFPRRWERLADDAIMPQLAVKPLLWVQALTLTVSMLVASLCAARSARPDIIHAHWLIPAGFIGSALRLIWGVPLVITAHGSDVFTLRSWPLRRMKQQIARRAEAMIVSSGDMHLALGVPSAIVQPAGVDVEFWREAVQPRAPESGRVLYVGRLAPNKGVAVAIRSIVDLPGIHLRIVGEGPDRARLEVLAASLDVQDRVKFIGHADRKVVADEYRRAMCVVIPSIEGSDGAREGTPSVLGESVAAGVPVVASALSGLKEHVVDNVSGLLVRPGDHVELSLAVRAFADDSDLRDRVSLNASLALAERLSTRSAANSYHTLYEAILNDRFSHRRRQRSSSKGTK